MENEKQIAGTSLGINPQNHAQRRVFYDLNMAGDKGEARHPMVVMRELAQKHGFTLIGAVPQSLFDGWDFWIESTNIAVLDLPCFFRERIPWKPVGQA